MKKSIVPVILVLLVSLGGLGLFHGWLTLRHRGSTARPMNNDVMVNLENDRDRIDEVLQPMTPKSARLLRID